MSETTIEWTHPPGFKGVTLNPVVGCRPVSPGCLNCYAATMAGTRLSKMSTSCGKYHGLTVLNNERQTFNGKVRLDEKALLAPLSWRRGTPRCAFICSMGDVFYGNEADRRAWESKGKGADPFEPVPFAFLDRLFAVMALTPAHRYLLLTKRPDRAAEYLNTDGTQEHITTEAMRIRPGSDVLGGPDNTPGGWPLPNVAIGCSVSTQRDADEHIPHLLKCPAAMRFVSYEPALEAVDFTALDWMRRGKTTVDSLRATATSNLMGDTHQADPTNRLDWLICGGESGAKARPFDLEWARSARAQCEAAGVAYFLKQLGLRPMASPPQWRADDDWLEDYLESGVAYSIEGGCTDPEVHFKFKDRHGGDEAEWPDDLRGCRAWPEAFFRQEATA